MMEYRRFGKTEINVSRLGMDCRAFGVRELDCGWDPFTYEGRIFATRTIHAALDMGINHFAASQADGDGYAESLLGTALAKRRRDVVLASRIPCRQESPGEILDRVVSCLRRLRTDYIDIIQIDRDASRVRESHHGLPAELLDTLLRLREKGIIRHLGLSATDLPDDTDAIGLVQLRYDAEDHGAAHRVMDRCQRHDLGVSIANPLARGRTRDSAESLRPNWSLIDDSDEFRLKFLLGDRRVHSINVGMRWEHEVHLNAALVGTPPRRGDAARGSAGLPRRKALRPHPEYPVRAPA